MDLLRVEQQRQALEQNLVELRHSLKHWQVLDAEYEGLKEEVLLDPSKVDAAGLEQIALTYDADLIDAAEIRKLTGLDALQPRSLPEIVRTIEHRQDYVQANIDTLQRQFFDAEAKLEEYDFAARRDSSNAYPLTEIHEELDDDDNVISSRLSRPEESQNQLVDSLRQAGLSNDDFRTRSNVESTRELPLKPAITNSAPSTPPAATGLYNPPSTGGQSDNQDHGHQPATRKKSVSFSIDTKGEHEMERQDSGDGKKSVSFAAKVAVAPAAPPPDPRVVSFASNIEEIPLISNSVASLPISPSTTNDAEVQKELRASFKPGDKVIQLNDDDEVIGEHIVIPENESEEDAQIRRDMLNYHLNEVGHVVAQLDIDETYGEDDDDTSSHYTGSTYLGDEDTPYTTGGSEDDDDEEDYDEDEFGRSQHSVITESYRQEMMDLQNRLIGNLGPTPKEDEITGIDAELNPQDARRLVVLAKPTTEEAAGMAVTSKKPLSKKRVSFAESVDMSDDRSNALPIVNTTKQRDGENIPPMTGLISEQNAHASMTDKPLDNKHIDDSEPSAAKLDDTPQPNDKILADTLVERPTSRPSYAPIDAESNSIMQRRELAAEYYRRRNDIIRQQGGFKRHEEDDDLGELMEEKDGKVKRVSRFKAARIQG